MNNLIHKLAAYLLFSLSTLISNQALAAVMLSGGLTHEYNAQPGASFNGVLQLRNTSPHPAELKIYQEDVRINGDGSSQYVPGHGSHARSNARWISLPVDRVVLAPGATRQINYTLSIPNNPQMQGSYWSTLMLEPISSNSSESQLHLPNDRPNVTIQQTVRYAVRILTNVGNQGQTNLNFSAPNISKTAHGGRAFAVDVQNTGNQFSRPTVWLDVFDMQGSKVGKFSAEPRSLYVGERKNYNINIAGLSPGQYKGLLAAEDDQSGQVFGTDINLNIQP